jgi:predicted Zn-dependent peptidase
LGSRSGSRAPAAAAPSAEDAGPAGPPQSRTIQPFDRPPGRRKPCPFRLRSFPSRGRDAGWRLLSRITSNIREDKGYTYSPYSYIDSHRGSAIWIEGADVTTNVTGESIKEILKEVNRMRQEPPSEKELQAVKNALVGQFVLQNASPGGLISGLIMTEEYSLGDDWLSSYVQKVSGVTRADVQRLSETMLDPNKMTIVVVGDKEKIDKSLEPYRN